MLYLFHNRVRDTIITDQLILFLQKEELVTASAFSHRGVSMTSHLGIPIASEAKS